ncbi:multiubiquitin domain-containing protein [Pseudomonas abietaniphila]|uniref:Multiubiquitin n=1 Tax=Pseudomonas abietaniphila TaxID=89065 RepID=A0A1G8MMP8_9PSED|nr:multiubiquitin domain-containing protein [Pseudomonas abietaniphila]SDI69126.1 Multiubiquitin [Pseudomonas abietaniphila]
MQDLQNQQRPITIHIGDENLNYREVIIHDHTPTGQQIALAAGFKPDDEAIVLMLLPAGLEDVSPNEGVGAVLDGQRFIVASSDRTYNFTVDGVRLPWLRSTITGEIIRKLADVPSDKRLLLEREDEADLEISNGAVVDLDAPGTERFITRPGIWKLNVQGTILDIHFPSISVRDALVLAGLDPNGNWLIFLKVEGQEKRALQMSDVIDLTTPGIEKLRLTPADVSNGESASTPLRQFDILPADASYLDAMGHRWETRFEPITGSEPRRWLVIQDYVLPEGYTSEKVQLALDIPAAYPIAQIDMFYLLPSVALCSGMPIPNVQVTAVIGGQTFQGWSRHRPWNPASDSIATQMSMVDGCLHKEVGK